MFVRVCERVYAHRVVSVVRSVFSLFKENIPRRVRNDFLELTGLLSFKFSHNVIGGVCVINDLLDMLNLFSGVKIKPLKPLFFNFYPIFTKFGG